MDFCDDCGILLPPNVESEYCNPCNEMKRKRKTAREPCDCELCHNSGSSQPVSGHGNSAATDFYSHRSMNISTSSSDDEADRQTSSKSSQPKGHNTSGGNQGNTDPGWTIVKKEKSPRSLAGNLVASDIREKWEKEQIDYKRQLCKTDTPVISALVSGCRRKEGGGRFYIGGVDISFIKGNNVDACACLSVIQMPDLQMVYQRMEMIQLTQPYIPGFLAFREVPALVDLYHEMEKSAPQYLPDLIMVDGNGMLHPRGFGLACQLGVVLDVPTMGVAKTLISAQGIVDDEAHKKKKKTLAGAGDDFDLTSDSGEVLGKCVRVHDQAPNPVYVSIGHKISIDSAVWLALECSKYRIPEPVRRADLDSREYLRQNRRDLHEFIKT
ncbi:endonuclease V [Aplysia californica]|uniref:Endonuclease V n=1 Tax=Aplysia californica TaxID=6500 RepID=A0ABM0JRQ1_APLCA|nr:endonuclease V [Aplysia californica]XP_035826076.1 endonuclease V [Aplysia californica]